MQKKSATVKKTIDTKVQADSKKLNLTVTPVSSFDHVPAPGNWVVALAIDSNIKNPDYHWWRRDGDGTWSHKPGSTAIMYWDSAGNTITDPGACDRGRYDYFCGYYEVGTR